MTLKDLGYKPRQASVRIVLDDNLRQQVEHAFARITHQKLEESKDGQGLGSKLPALQAELEEAERTADESAVTFVFQALPRRRIADLVTACPPSETQLARWKESVRAAPLVARPVPEFDWDRFAPRLIAACMTSPSTTEGEVLEMWEDGDWSDAVWEQLWKAAWSVNQEVSTRPTFGTDSKPT